MPDKYDPDEKFKLDIGDEEPEDAFRWLLDRKQTEVSYLHGREPGEREKNAVVEAVVAELTEPTADPEDEDA